LGFLEEVQMAEKSSEAGLEVDPSAEVAVLILLEVGPQGVAVAG
jgi:hypothetical protein